MEKPHLSRRYLRADPFKELRNFETDQKKGQPFPPPQKPYPDDAILIDLPPASELNFHSVSVMEAINRRRSVRDYTDQPFSLEELSFMCWVTQGIKDVLSGGLITKRTVPSGGARHPFETYLSIHRVSGLDVGLYRYLAFEHKLLQLTSDPNLPQKLGKVCADFAQKSSVTFVWTAIPYRTEWRYHEAAYKLIAQDSGHMCQNLYLACEAIGAGTCAVGAYDQNGMDDLLGLDGSEELTVYCAPVGKVG